MVNLKSTKIYMLPKKFFFVVVNFLLKTIDLKNWEYYYSKWIIDNGDEILLTKYPLNSESIVVDIGGYTGYFSDKIVDLYNPHITILEPVKKFYKILKNKYANNKKVEIYNYGLSNKNSQQKIYLSDDGTSLIKKSDKTETIKLIDATTFFRKFKSIDLLSINIEGAEYEVLERLLETRLIKKIKFLQVQFHSFVPEASNRRQNMIKNILKTHKIYFSYPFVWESFRLKN